MFYENHTQSTATGGLADVSWVNTINLVRMGGDNAAPSGMNRLFAMKDALQDHAPVGPAAGHRGQATVIA